MAKKVTNVVRHDGMTLADLRRFMSDCVAAGLDQERSQIRIASTMTGKLRQITAEEMDR